MQKIVRIALGAAATLGFAGSVQAQELITNGGFEAPSIAPNGFQPTTTVPGFTVTSGNVDLISSPTYSVNSGNQAIDLVGSGVSTGSIAQTFNTVLGQAYKLVFAYSANGGCAGACSATVSVGSGGFTSTTGGTAANASTFSAAGGAAYTAFTGFFTATGTSTTLSFADTSGQTNQGVFLDDVSVQAVPELATWGMMIVGFGAVGSVLRRRRVTFRPTLATA